MVEGAQVDTSSWEVHGLQKLVGLCETAKAQKKYLFIWDKQGSVATFMQYKGHLVQLGPSVLKVALQQSTWHDCGEIVRKGFVDGMRSGDNMCLDIDKSRADWNAMNQDGTFNAQTFFDWPWLEVRENHLQYVREEENHGVGGLNPGIGYSRQDSFLAVIRSGAEDEGLLSEQIALIPHFDQMMKVIIE